MLLEHKVPQLMATQSQPTPVAVVKKTPVKTVDGSRINGTSDVTNDICHVTNGTAAAVHVLG